MPEPAAVLPDDWETQVARAYATFGLDPLDEFGPLDNLRRSAADRAKSAMEQARSTGGQFIKMGTEVGAKSGRVVRARLGAKLNEYMSRSLQPDLTDNIADHESMPKKIANAVLSVMKEFFWPTIEEPKRRGGGRSSGGGGGGRTPNPGDLTPEQKEKLDEAVKWMNQAAPPTTRFTETDMGTFRDEDGNLIQRTPEGKWEATNGAGKKVGEYDSAMEAESALNPQKTQEKYDQILNDFADKHKDSKNKTVKAIVDIVEERETAPRWMAPKAAANLGEYLQGLTWDENGVARDAEGHVASDNPDEFQDASQAIHDLVKLQKLKKGGGRKPAAKKTAAEPEEPLFQSTVWDRRLPPEGLTASAIPGISESDNPTDEEARLREAVAESAAVWRAAQESLQQQREWLARAKAELPSYDRVHPLPRRDDYSDGTRYEQALTSWEISKIGHRNTIDQTARSLNSASLILGGHRKNFVKAMDALADEQGMHDGRWWNR